ncbi:hypothetical protein LEP1GSC082_1516 [Leptospira kirschneri str. H2]|nr:hypothetical protein LEP1GSC082_1516 [Leptospira kirschneri str. H2]
MRIFETAILFQTTQVLFSICSFQSFRRENHPRFFLNPDSTNVFSH